VELMRRKTRADGVKKLKEKGGGGGKLNRKGGSMGRVFYMGVFCVTMKEFLGGKAFCKGGGR